MSNEEWVPEGYEELKQAHRRKDYAHIVSSFDAFTEANKKYQELRIKYPAAYLFLLAELDLNYDESILALIRESAQECKDILKRSKGRDLDAARKALNNWGHELRRRNLNEDEK